MYIYMQSFNQLCPHMVLSISPIMFNIVSVASCAAGLRWTLVQKLKGVDQVYRRPMYCLYSFGPMSIMAITPFALYDIIRYDIL